MLVLLVEDLLIALWRMVRVLVLAGVCMFHTLHKTECTESAYVKPA